MSGEAEQLCEICFCEFDLGIKYTCANPNCNTFLCPECVEALMDAHADPNDLDLNDDTQQQRGQGSAYEAETDPVVLPAQYTRLALQMQNDPTRRHQFSSPRPSSLPSANWSLPLPRPLAASGMIVATLNDARVLIERLLQSGSRTKEMWTYVSNELREAALADDTEKFSSVLEMALSLEGLQWELK